MYLCWTCLSMFIVVLARKDEDAVLTCNTAAGRAVTWKLKDYDLDMLECKPTENGRRLTVSKEDPQMGEYSCWSEEQMLSTVFLLHEGKESGEIFFFISHSSRHSFKYSSLCISNFIISLSLSWCVHIVIWIDSTFHCRATSYDCSFSCKWMSSGYAAVRVGLGPEW